MTAELGHVTSNGLPLEVSNRATHNLGLEEREHVTARTYTRRKIWNGGKVCNGLYARENEHPFVSAQKYMGTSTKSAEIVARVSSRLAYVIG